MIDKKEKIVNLCDRSINYIITQEDFMMNKYDRIMIGSYSCPNYFLNLISSSMINRIENYDLVIPIMPESLLYMFDTEEFANASEKASVVIANDFGTLERLYPKYNNIRMGRLFCRDYRDHRYCEYENSLYISKIPSILKTLKERKVYIKQIETDIITYNFQMPCGIKTYLHFPYRQVSISHICEYSSIGKKIEDKFIPDDLCKMQCLNQFLIYPKSGYIKIGKNIFDKIKKTKEIEKLINDSSIIISPRWIL